MNMQDLLDSVGHWIRWEATRLQQCRRLELCDVQVHTTTLHLLGTALVIDPQSTLTLRSTRYQFILAQNLLFRP